MTDWLATCRAAVEDVRGVLAELPSRSDREPVVGAGMGGDDTTAIDAAVERAVVARFDAAADGFTPRLRGARASGWAAIPGSSLDPIDGSINAKRGLPFFSLSVAVAEGGTMGDVTFGYVYDFGTGEEWTAERGGGARLNGSAVRAASRPRTGSRSSRSRQRGRISSPAMLRQLVGLVHRLRVFGSLAISLCHLADGRLDAVCSLKAARAVDIAAAQLLVRERGYAIDLPEAPPFEDAPLDLEGRSRVVAAGTTALCATVAAALSA